MRLSDRCRSDSMSLGSGAPAQRRRPRTAVAVNYLSGFLSRALLLPLLIGERAVAHRQRSPRSAQHPLDFDDVMLTKGICRDTRLCAEQARADHVHDRSRAGKLDGFRRDGECTAPRDLYEYHDGARRRQSHRSARSSRAAKPFCILADGDDMEGKTGLFFQRHATVEGQCPGL